MKPWAALFLLGAAAPFTWPPTAQPILVHVAGAGGPVDLQGPFAAAAATYNGVLATGMRLATVAAASGGPVRDGRSTASFGPMDASLYAQTFTWTNAAGITEIDIVFRADACWTEGLADGTPVGPGGCPVDLETVALHELGHAVGFVHTTSPLEEPSVMEGAINFVRRDLEAKDLSALAREYPPRLVVAPEAFAPTGVGPGEEGVVLAGALGLMGFPAALEGLSVSSVAGPPLAEVRLEHETLAGRVVLGASNDPAGPWQFAFAPITPTASDRLEVVARRSAPAPPLALLALLGLSLVPGGRKRNGVRGLLLLVFALSACGGGDNLAASPGWRFEVAASGLVAQGDAAIVGGVWRGPAIDPTP